MTDFGVAATRLSPATRSLGIPILIPDTPFSKRVFLVIIDKVKLPAGGSSSPTNAVSSLQSLKS